MAQEKPIEYHIEKIEEFHNMKLDYPDSETIERKLYDQLSQWEYKHDRTYYISGQEQYPWTAEKLGHKTDNMLTVAEVDKYFTKRFMANPYKLNIFDGFERDDIQPQAGDYQCHYEGPGYHGWIPVVVERKGGKEGQSGPEDLYGSLSNIDNRRNIYEEIDRIKMDKRFFYRYLIAECTYDQYMKYVPLFKGRGRNVDHISVSAETRQATIASLEIRGIHVIWAGTRAMATQMYKHLNRQWMMKNYVRILGL